MNRLHNECDKDEKTPKGMEPLLNKLLKSRTIMLAGEINKDLAERVTTQLLVLDSESNEPIRLFIDSPGGDADAGYAIFDMIRFIKSPVYTISNGLTASAGVIIALAAPRKHRFTLPSSRWLIHQPSSGMMGVAADIHIHAQEIVRLKNRINELIAAETDRTADQVRADTERDRWLHADEAVEYGLCGKVIKSVKELPEKP